MSFTDIHEVKYVSPQLYMYIFNRGVTVKRRLVLRKLTYRLYFCVLNEKVKEKIGNIILYLVNQYIHLHTFLRSDDVDHLQILSFNTGDEIVFFICLSFFNRPSVNCSSL